MYAFSRIVVSLPILFTLGCGGLVSIQHDPGLGAEVCVSEEFQFEKPSIRLVYKEFSGKKKRIVIEENVYVPPGVDLGLEERYRVFVKRPSEGKFFEIRHAGLSGHNMMGEKELLAHYYEVSGNIARDLVIVPRGGGAYLFHLTGSNEGGE